MNNKILELEKYLMNPSSFVDSLMMSVQNEIKLDSIYEFGKSNNFNVLEVRKKNLFFYNECEKYIVVRRIDEKGNFYESSSLFNEFDASAISILLENNLIDLSISFEIFCSACPRIDSNSDCQLIYAVYRILDEFVFEKFI